MLKARSYFAVIVTILICLLLRIRDMYNPFEYGSHTYADEAPVYIDSYFEWQAATPDYLPGFFLVTGEPLSQSFPELPRLSAG